MAYKDPEKRKAYYRAYTHAYYLAHRDPTRAKRPRRPQPKGGIFAEIMTAEGVTMGKLCAGPCQELKPLTDFSRDRARAGGYRSWCNLCEQPRSRAYNRTEKRRARARAYARERGPRPPRPRVRTPCVYTVQLLARVNTIKIGKTDSLSQRLSRLKQLYGPLHTLLVIPCQDPGALEVQLHTLLQDFRLYEGGKKTELFQFTTKRGRHAMHRVLTQYRDCTRESPLWDIRPPSRGLVEEQLGLFG